MWLVPQDLGPEPIAWHRHELLFGSGGAALGGYLLTALPAWTGSAPVSPAVTRALVMLWLAGRVAFASPLPSSFACLVAASYFLALGGVLLHHICRARAWTRLVLAGAPFVLAAAELATGSGCSLADGPFLFRVLTLFFALLIAIVGGRAVPAFIRHWLEGRDGSRPNAMDRWMSRCGIAALVVAIVFYALGADVIAGRAMVLSAVIQIIRILSWRGWMSWRYPALMVLHLAWLWLPSGLMLVGLSLSTSIYPDIASALHSLTMGAMGTMMFAIMGRAAMTRSGGRLSMSPAFALGFGCVWLAALLRLLVPVAGAAEHLILLLSATFWMAGWALFVWNFRHAFRGDVRRPVLSARPAKHSPSPVEADGALDDRA